MIPRKIIQLIQISSGRSWWSSAISILEEMADGMMEEFSTADFQNIWNFSQKYSPYFRDDLWETISQNFIPLIQDRFSSRMWLVERYYFSKNIGLSGVSSQEIEWFIVNLLSVAFADMMAVAFLENTLWMSEKNGKSLLYRGLQKWTLESSGYINHIIFSEYANIHTSGRDLNMFENIKKKLKSVWESSRKECPFLYAQNRNTWIDVVYEKMKQVDFNSSASR